MSTNTNPKKTEKQTPKKMGLTKANLIGLAIFLVISISLITAAFLVRPDEDKNEDDKNSSNTSQSSEESSVLENDPSSDTVDVQNTPDNTEDSGFTPPERTVVSAEEQQAVEIETFETLDTSEKLDNLIQDLDNTAETFQVDLEYNPSDINDENLGLN